ncbi:MAG: hypothetical protein WD075_02045 [Rhodospirillales bacterium]
MTVMQAVRLIIPCLTIAILHITIVSDHANLAPAAMALGPVGYLLLAFATGAAWRQKLGLTVVILGLAGLQILTLSGDNTLARAIAVPPILIQGWLAWVFGRTLLPGKEPLIHRISRLNRGRVPAELDDYTRRMTVLWTVMFVVMLVVSVTVGLAAEPDTWSWVVNIGLPATAATVFFTEHGYRAIKFRHLGHNSPLATLRTMIRPGTWIAP